jgi:outer membrane beta-barrel protein
MRGAVILSAALWLALVASSWADAATGSGEDEYNFNWLDPEKKIYVLQNRRYLKANRPMLSLLMGPGISNSYRNVFSVEPRFAFYFKEDWGLEVFYAKSYNSNSTTYTQLLSTNPTVVPVVREINSTLGINVHWVPWYSKINVFNKILYFDWYFSGGAGTMGSTLFNSAGMTSQDLFSLFLGTGHQYHFTHEVAFRFDFSGAVYRAPFNGVTGDQQWFSDFRFAFGLGWRI